MISINIHWQLVLKFYMYMCRQTLPPTSNKGAYAFSSRRATSVNHDPGGWLSSMTSLRRSCNCQRRRRSCHSPTTRILIVPWWSFLWLMDSFIYKSQYNWLPKIYQNTTFMKYDSRLVCHSHSRWYSMNVTKR